MSSEISTWLDEASNTLGDLVGNVTDTSKRFKIRVKIRTAKTIKVKYGSCSLKSDLHTSHLDLDTQRKLEISQSRSTFLEEHYGGRNYHQKHCNYWSFAQATL